MRKKYFIWSESNSKDFYIGEAYGESFENAVVNYYTFFPNDSFNSTTLTLWGYTLYPGKNPGWAKG